MLCGLNLPSKKHISADYFDNYYNWKENEKKKSNKILPCMLLCQVWAVQGISQKMQKLEGEIGFGYLLLALLLRSNQIFH